MEHSWANKRPLSLSILVSLAILLIVAYILLGSCEQTVYESCDSPGVITDRDLTSDIYTKVPELSPEETAFLAEFESRYTSADTTQDIRRSAITVVFKANELDFTAMPDQVAQVDSVPDFYGRDNFLLSVEEILRISTTMEHGFASVSYLFLPEEHNGDYIVYHAGHSPNGWLPNHSVVKRFLDEGFGVVAMSMPNTGENIAPPYLKTNTGPKYWLPQESVTYNHSRLAYLETPGFSPLKLFLHPVLVNINYLAQRSPTSRITMTGESGGAWTTAVYAALDTRISRSVPVAGSLPLFAIERLNTCVDFEYSNPQLLGAMNFLDMMILASCDRGRKQVQVTHQFEQYFYGLFPYTYEAIVKRVLSGYCEGQWDFLITSEEVHQFGEEATEVVLRLANEE